jgi:hypothetical protein
MKKYFSFLLLFITCVHASAQVTTSVKAGLALANVEFKGDDNYQIRVVGYGGLSVNIPLADKIFFQPEALYSIRGYGFRPTATSERHKVYFGYITAPLLVGYKVSKSFSIVAGPELGYMVRARSRFDGNNYNFYEGLNRKFNVDVDAGVAWNMMKQLTLEARINFGVTALYRGVLVDPQGNPFADVKDGYHRVVQLGLSLPL